MASVLQINCAPLHETGLICLAPSSTQHHGPAANGPRNSAGKSSTRTQSTNSATAMMAPNVNSCARGISTPYRLGLSVAAGVVDEDVVSTLAGRLARLGRECSPEQKHAIQAASGGTDLSALGKSLLDSIDPDKTRAVAVEQLNLPTGQEPTEKQLDQVERERMSQALRAFHNPVLGEAISAARREL